MRRHLRFVSLLVALLMAAAACATSEDSTEDTSAPTEDTDGDAEGDGGDGGDDGDDEEVETVDLTQGGSILEQVIANDVVRCGTRDALPGFAVLQPDGTHEGFDNDFCRAVAAAVLGDAEKVEFIDLETEDRFTALQSGEIDVLIRNTTWTASRDGVEGATFLTPNFYDGQGMMVETGAFDSLEDMDGTVVCVASGTTTEGNVATEFDRLGLSVEVLSFADTDLIQEAFLAGRCDGWSSDVSQLTALRSAYPEGADALTILSEVFSKEPLAPAVVDGDSAWAQAVNWAILATIQAEELGITADNVDDFLDSEDPIVRRFLGVEVDGAVLDAGLGLPADFNYQVVSQVGNYGEIYERHITPLGLPRGFNSQWFDGGMLYAPPYR